MSNNDINIIFKWYDINGIHFTSDSHLVILQIYLFQQ